MFLHRNPAGCSDWAAAGYCNTAFDGQPVATFWCAASCGTCSKPNNNVDVCIDERYVVKPGDTLRSIALDQGVSINAIKAANNITDSFAQVYAGAALTIPCAGVLLPANLDGNAPGSCPVYRVKEDENFLILAAQWGVSFNELLAANPEVCHVGCVLIMHACTYAYPSWRTCAT